MRYCYVQSNSLILTMLFAFFPCLLVTHCTGSPKTDYADALKICSEKNANKDQFIFLPSTECVVGTRFPKFECTTIRNKKINEDYFKGKVSIVNFWFEGCPPCVAEVPGFNQLANNYGKDRLRYLAISLDSQEDVEAFLKNHEWDFDHVSNGKSISTDIFHLPWGYPTTFLVDQNGIIIKVINGGKVDSTAISLIQENLIPPIDSLLNDN